MKPANHQPTDRPGDSRYWPVDLHAHTSASDGTLRPHELVALAAERGIQVLAVTDHDTVDGLAAARGAAADLGVVLVPAVELSTTERGVELHVLGYGVDPDDPSLLGELRELARSRVGRITAMIARLHAAGFAVDRDSILAQSEEGSIGRPHLARALIEIGAATSVDDAFQRFLKPGRPGWVPRDPFTPEQAVALLVDHNALPVLAHPWSTGDIPAILRRLIPLGLRGMEVFYGEYDAGRRSALRDIADHHALIATGGSDYHGPHFREGRELGAAPVPIDVFDELVAAGVRA
ncbi:MAG: PHP domain-containing protein [Chloroflexia bacterium]|nr:PHP domain-containing protein [Chloroflexia bacterium]